MKKKPSKITRGTKRVYKILLCGKIREEEKKKRVAQLMENNRKP